MVDRSAINLTIDASLAQMKLKQFDKKTVRKALSLAANGAAAGMVSPLAKLMKARTGVRTEKPVKSRIDVTKANPSTLTAILRLRSRPIGLSQFADPRQAKKKPKKGVKAKVFGKSRVYRRTFFMEVASGKREIFRRTGKGRLPIQRMFGPSLTSFARMRGVSRKLDLMAKQTLQKSIKREVDRVWSVRSGKVKLSAAAQKKFNRSF